MNTYLPLFPLNLVAFPGEPLNLHVFEPRYKQLMQDILEGDRRFGIPAYVTDTMDYGTEVLVEQVVRVYPDGRMDIRTQGKRVFRVLTFDNPMTGKLYAGGKVEFLDQDGARDHQLEEELRVLVKEFFQTIQIETPTDLPSNLSTFSLAHRVGLSAEQKYALLKCNGEFERQQMIIDHLYRAIPLLQDVEQTKDRIKMNGHFRHFDPLTF